MYWTRKKRIVVPDSSPPAVDEYLLGAYALDQVLLDIDFR